jgi:glucose-1-phosphate cytidylyltransferase
MKVIILAGGFGTRLSEYTDLVPKPMVKIGGKPILWHIMQRYAYYGHKDFYLALGYKGEVVKQFFLNYKLSNSDFTISLAEGHVKSYGAKSEDWTVTCVDTGSNTMTGGRIKRLKDFIGSETALITYGDGVADIDLDGLVNFHKGHGKMVTVTAVRPSARFGELEMIGGEVRSFKEKPQIHQGWINGGYFVIEPEFFDYISGDETVLEREPLEMMAKLGQLCAWRHEGYWQCMDTKRDKDSLEEIYSEGEAPWMRYL